MGNRSSSKKKGTARGCHKGGRAEEAKAFEASAFPHGCPHYRRRCRLVAPCCGIEVWCRLCHDAATEEGEYDGEAHKLDRHAVKEVVCALCSTRQPSAAVCTHCHTTMGEYFCPKCNLFDDNTTKQQFHCDACGICRVGGQENMLHCSNCRMCVRRDKPHACRTDAVRSDCPVCLEFMFDSREPLTMLGCGHALHTACMRGMLDAHTYTCPLCSKSMVSDAAMLTRQKDREIASTPMPRRMQNARRRVLCNDCRQKSVRPFHIVGHKCAHCGGYNTVVVEELPDGTKCDEVKAHASS